MTNPPRRRVTAKTNPKTAERTVGEEYKILLEMLKAQNQSIEGLRQVVAQGHERSSESRARLHDRIDEVGERIGRLEGSIGILGQVDGQVRNELDGLKTALQVYKDATTPTVESMADLMKTGRRVSIILGIAGLSAAGVVAAMLTWFGETLPAIIKGWLRIG